MNNNAHPHLCSSVTASRVQVNTSKKKTGLVARSVMRSVTARRKRQCAEKTALCEVVRGAREERHQGKVIWGVVRRTVQSGQCEQASREENMEMFESETRGPGNQTRGPTNDTGASKRHITGDRSTQAGAKRSIDPTSAFSLRSELPLRHKSFMDDYPPGTGQVGMAPSGKPTSARKGCC